MSYKVGDKVRIVDHWNDECCQNFDGYMDEWLGKVMTIASMTSWGSYIMKEDNGRWVWNASTIAGLAEDFEEKIVITHNKKDTIARYYKDGKCVRKAAAHCHKDDDFDFNEGARRAFNRLLEMIPMATAYVDEKVNAALKKRPKYYTAKIVCVDNHHLPHWQVGKIYHVTDGKLENDDAPTYKFIGYRSLKEINETHFAQFIEVVE